MDHSKILPIPIGKSVSSSTSSLDKQKKYNVVFENGYSLNQSVMMPTDEASPPSIFINNLKQRMQIYNECPFARLMQNR
jgi:hypothetical protein